MTYSLPEWVLQNKSPELLWLLTLSTSVFGSLAQCALTPVLSHIQGHNRWDRTPGAPDSLLATWKAAPRPGKGVWRRAEQEEQSLGNHSPSSGRFVLTPGAPGGCCHLEMLTEPGCGLTTPPAPPPRPGNAQHPPQQLPGSGQPLTERHFSKKPLEDVWALHHRLCLQIPGESMRRALLKFN